MINPGGICFGPVPGTNEQYSLTVASTFLLQILSCNCNRGLQRIVGLLEGIALFHGAVFEAFHEPAHPLVG